MVIPHWLNSKLLLSGGNLSHCEWGTLSTCTAPIGTVSEPGLLEFQSTSRLYCFHCLPPNKETDIGMAMLVASVGWVSSR